MNSEPLIFQFKLDDFDLDLLPIAADLVKSNKELHEKAVALYFEQYFKKAGGDYSIKIDGKDVIVQWSPGSLKDVDGAVIQVIDLLVKGAYRQAEPILHTLNERYPDNTDVLFNYGMMLSDTGRLKEAIEFLSQLTKIDPNHANGWNALGVAYLRNGQLDNAKAALEQSYRLDSENGYTLRNLGAILLKEDVKKALPIFKRAAELLPSDQQAQYGYAFCLSETGKKQDADSIFKKAIDISPYSEISELCRAERTKIAQSTMRETTPNGVRMDVVMYCKAALERFKTLGPEKSNQITAEIALLGRQGLDINNPDKKYTLKSLDGEFTGLQLVSYMYVGFKKIAPDRDVGIDLSKEYNMALKLSKGKGVQ
jgi:tetratricopeptide (TPR) repeat protein